MPQKMESVLTDKPAALFPLGDSFQNQGDLFNHDFPELGPQVCTGLGWATDYAG
jgi:hypothetical protein